MMLSPSELDQQLSEHFLPIIPSEYNLNKRCRADWFFIGVGQRLRVSGSSLCFGSLRLQPSPKRRLPFQNQLVKYMYIYVFSSSGETYCFFNSHPVAAALKLFLFWKTGLVVHSWPLLLTNAVWVRLRDVPCMYKARLCGFSWLHDWDAKWVKHIKVLSLSHFVSPLLNPLLHPS